MVLDPQAEVEAVCRTVYAETAAFHRGLTTQLGDRDFGYRILYGPPKFRPPVVFIGYQPGGKKEARKVEEEASWPDELDYATQDWHLARRIREVFDVAFLTACMGSNTIFFRAQNVRQYRTMDASLLAEIEEFCRARLDAILTAVQPQKLIFIGLSQARTAFTFEHERESAGRILSATGYRAGIPALAVLHLSGARMSHMDLALIYEDMRRFAAS